MIDTLLLRLKKVRLLGRDSWMACCPAHEDERPSLAIRNDDGQILIHCFAGCEPTRILEAVGMDMADLFPRFHETLPPIRNKFLPGAVLQLIRHEVLIVGLAAIQVKNGQPLSDEDQERLIVAIGRIQEATNYAG